MLKKVSKLLPYSRKQHHISFVVLRFSTRRVNGTGVFKEAVHLYMYIYESVSNLRFIATLINAARYAKNKTIA